MSKVQRQASETSFHWDRGRLARNEREARTVFKIDEELRACGAFAGETPAVPVKAMDNTNAKLLF